MLRQTSLAYLFLNLAGSAILAALAYREQQWGFVLLADVWALISLWSLGLAPWTRAAVTFPVREDAARVGPNGRGRQRQTS